MRRIKVNKIILAIVLFLLLGIFIYGGKRVYKSIIDVKNENDYLGNITIGTESNAAYYLTENIVKAHMTNPFITQGSDNNYYMYGNNNAGIGASNGTIISYQSPYTDVRPGQSWTKSTTQTINGLPSNVSEPISPKVYKIGNYYYLFFTLISNYNQSSETQTKNVYYAVATELNLNTAWTYVGIVPVGTVNSENQNRSNGSVYIEDINKNKSFDDGDNIYFYYHSENNNNGYSVKLRSNNGVLIADSESQVLISLSEDITRVDEPYVIKENGIYKLYFSKKITNGYTYNVAYAESDNSAAGPFTIVNSEFLDESNSRSAGGLSIFQIYTKDEVNDNMYADNYYVFHRLDLEDSIPTPSNAKSYFRKNFDVRPENESGLRIPVFTGTKDPNISGLYRDTFSKEKYEINDESATKFKGMEITKTDKLKINLSSRQDIRELILYTDSDLPAIKLVPNINEGLGNQRSPLRSTQNGEYLAFLNAEIKKGMIRIILKNNLQATINGKVTDIKIKNIEIALYNAADKLNIKDVQLVTLSDSANEYNGYHFIDYETEKPTTAPAVTTDCVSKLIRTTEEFVNSCTASRNYYTFNYTNEGDTEHNGKRLVSDYIFNYNFEPIKYTITYNYDSSSVGEIVTEQFAYEEKDEAKNYKNYTLPETPTKVGYTFGGWIDQNTNTTFTAAMITGGKGFKDYDLKAKWNANTIKVTFDACNGSTTSTTSYNKLYGSTYGKSNTGADAPLPVPTFKGKKFLGWFTDEVGGIKIEDTSTVNDAAPHTLYAHWAEGEYNITIEYNPNNGTTTVVNMDSLEKITGVLVWRKKYNDLYNLPTLKRDGYDFVGWYTAATSGTKITNTTRLTNDKDHSVYARWTAKDVTINFDSNEGSKVASVSKKYDSNFGTLTTPTRTGYTFDGWYTEKEGGTKIESSTRLSDCDIFVSVGGTETYTETLYAHWSAKVVSVTFDLNDASGSTKGVIENDTNVTVAYDGKIASLPNVTRNGYTFDGWFKAKTGIDIVDTNTQFTSTANIVLYAHWTPIVYKVKIDKQNGTQLTPAEDITFDTVLPASLFGINPTKEGYKFAGWYDSATGGNKITPGNSKLTKFSENKDVPIILFAQWANLKYSVIYNATDGAFGSYKTKTVENEYETKYSFPTPPTRTGYRFDGWFTLPEDGIKINENDLFIQTTTQYLYAHWSEALYKITFDSNGGSTPNPAYIERKYNVDYGEFPTVTKTGYTFKNWTKEKVAGTVVTETSKTIDKDHTVYANWTANTIKVNYDVNGGNALSTTSVNKTFDSTYGTLSTPTRTGYTFAGWYTAATDGEKIEGTTKVINPSEHTIYAHWTPVKVKITLNLNGGTASTTSVELEYDGSYDALPTPTKDGNSFVGWYTAASGGTQYDLTKKVDFTTARTFYAHWGKVTCKLSYDANGGSNVDRVDNLSYGDKYPTAPTPTREGYKFEGWYTEKTGGTKVTTNTVVNQQNDHVLYAHWTPNTYTVTFNKNGGTITGTTISVTYDSKYSNLPTEGTKKGYLFDGWKDSKGNAINNDTIYKYPGPQTIVAQWKLEEYTVKYGNKTKTYNITTETFALEEPAARVGYVFAGYLGEGLTAPSKTVKIAKGSTGNKVYEAVWTTENGDSVAVVNLSEKKGMKASDYISKNTKYKKVLNANRTEKTTTDLIKTGDIAVDSSNKETIIIITMDVNGDGKINTLDYVKIWNHLDKNNPNNLDGDKNIFARLAADINGDGKISTIDYVKIWNLISNK